MLEFQLERQIEHRSEIHHLQGLWFLNSNFNGVVHGQVHGLVHGVVSGAVHSVVDKNIPIITESAYFSISFTRLTSWNIHFSFGFTRDSLSVSVLFLSDDDRPWIPESLYS